MGSLLRLGPLAVPTLARSFTGVFSKARVEGSSGHFSHWVLAMLCLFSWAELIFDRDVLQLCFESSAVVHCPDWAQT